LLCDPLRRGDGNEDSRVGVRCTGCDHRISRLTGRSTDLSAHMKGGFFHDGRFATLKDVIDHYNKNDSLKLTDQEVNQLVEFLKSL
jgi:hypothetical protein